MQQVIPAISNHKKLKEFLESDLSMGILMNFQLAQLEVIVNKMKEARKKILIHSELIKGLSSDEYGAIYLIQNLQVDGIISSKPKVIETCKKRNIMGVYRFFIKDTISLEQSIEIAQRLRPDFIEILPGSCFELIPDLKQKLNCQIWMGGLINSEANIQQCFIHGANAITTSNTDYWQ
ncbi:MAG: glycerol-3-phosphate responsive antiterminator [Candidatus Izemoplasmatales bacterium]|uniref:Glycerol-3-phosphate responsive antiterminator n=1 Tax=Hujiaoplasma nucleasis TaxID=2725268 RepID=A0A7L6N7A6_9MOLU|nr:glycerol-3-phosphate responsive antiterminator [Hujiaoplasma nucleasis]QLY40855.1 glycerol-3-phosphate responsive antiterminator [Hujiaoplasma nucleasis]